MFRNNRVGQDYFRHRQIPVRLIKCDKDAVLVNELNFRLYFKVHNESYETHIKHLKMTSLLKKKII